MSIPSLFCGFIFTSWSLLPWPQSSCSSSWLSCPQVCRQDGDQWQLGAGHRGNQRGRSRPADGQLWENGDRHDAGERHPPGSNAVTRTSSPALQLWTPPPPVLQPSLTYHLRLVSVASPASRVSEEASTTFVLLEEPQTFRNDSQRQWMPHLDLTIKTEPECFYLTFQKY